MFHIPEISIPSFLRAKPISDMYANLPGVVDGKFIREFHNFSHHLQNFFLANRYILFWQWGKRRSQEWDQLCAMIAIHDTIFGMPAAHEESYDSRLPPMFQRKGVDARDIKVNPETIKGYFETAKTRVTQAGNDGLKLRMGAFLAMIDSFQKARDTLGINSHTYTDGATTLFFARLADWAGHIASKPVNSDLSKELELMYRFIDRVNRDNVFGEENLRTPYSMDTATLYLGSLLRYLIKAEVDYEISRHATREYLLKLANNTKNIIVQITRALFTIYVDDDIRKRINIDTIAQGFNLNEPTFGRNSFPETRFGKLPIFRTADNIEFGSQLLLDSIGNPKPNFIAHLFAPDNAQDVRGINEIVTRDYDYQSICVKIIAYIIDLKWCLGRFNDAHELAGSGGDVLICLYLGDAIKALLTFHEKTNTALSLQLDLLGKKCHTTYTNLNDMLLLNTPIWKNRHHLLSSFTDVAAVDKRSNQELKMRIEQRISECRQPEYMNDLIKRTNSFIDKIRMIAPEILAADRNIVVPMQQQQPEQHAIIASSHSRTEDIKRRAAISLLKKQIPAPPAPQPRQPPPIPPRPPLFFPATPPDALPLRQQRDVGANVDINPNHPDLR